jgi:hypothetical protein
MERDEMESAQEFLDRHYWKNGPCCAGCDWWRSLSSRAGECLRSAPVSGSERWAMLGIEALSLDAGAGHVATKREHVCGEFKDDFDWSSLSLAYRKKVGAPLLVGVNTASAADKRRG